MPKACPIQRYNFYNTDLSSIQKRITLTHENVEEINKINMASLIDNKLQSDGMILILIDKIHKAGEYFVDIQATSAAGKAKKTTL